MDYWFLWWQYNNSIISKKRKKCQRISPLCLEKRILVYDKCDNLMKTFLCFPFFLVFTPYHFFWIHISWIVQFYLSFYSFVTHKRLQNTIIDFITNFNFRYLFDSISLIENFLIKSFLGIIFVCISMW